VDVLQVAEPVKLGAGEAAVGENDLPCGDQVVVDLDQSGHNVAFVEFRVGQASQHRHPLGGRGQPSMSYTPGKRVSMPIAGSMILLIGTRLT
jgi:hypothetical protein